MKSFLTPLPLRTWIAVQIAKLGPAFESLALAIMTRKNLVDWNKRYFENHAEKQNALPRDLSTDEKRLIESIATTKHSKDKTVLVLGSGFGREAIAFAQFGWRVTAIEMSEYLIELARQNAAAQKVMIEWHCHDLSQQLPFFIEKFDLITLFGQINYYLPTQVLRIQLLKACGDLLKPEGSLVMNSPVIQKFSENDLNHYRQRLALAKLFRGYAECELGDRWNLKEEFFHCYPSQTHFDHEIVEANLEILNIPDLTSNDLILLKSTDSHIVSA